MAGIEIRSTGDLTLASDLDLNALFGAGLRQGGLTLRAAGNLVLNGGALRSTANLTLSANRGIAVGPTSGSGSGRRERRAG